MDDVIELQRRNRFGDIESGSAVNLEDERNALDLENSNQTKEVMMMKKQFPTWDPVKEEQVTGVVVTRPDAHSDISLSDTDSSIAHGAVTTNVSYSRPVQGAESPKKMNKFESVLEESLNIDVEDGESEVSTPDSTSASAAPIRKS